MRVIRLAGVLAVAATVLVVPAAQAVHFYRGPGGGCTANSGEITDAGATNGPVGATVAMLHNTFNDAESGGPVTFVTAGEAVRWTWNSAHCHSATSAAFNSGFHYPTQEPSSPALLPGLFHYPVPESVATLAYTHTFDTPGTYTYNCVHHAAIGMQGVVVVS